MATEYVKFVANKYIEDVDTSQYTLPATELGNSTGVIDLAKALNTSSSHVTVDFYIVTSSGSPSGENQAIKTKTVPPNESVFLSEIMSVYLGEGDAIYAKASTASAVNLHIYGRVIN